MTKKFKTSKIFNTKTRKQEEIPFENLESAILSGTHAYKKKDSINIFDPETGDKFTVSGSELAESLKQGYKIENPRQTAIDEYVKQNAGVKGAAKVALGQFADEFAGGLPELIYDKTMDEFDVAKKDALKAHFEFTNNLAGIAGAGASLFTGVGPLKFLTKGADKVSKAVARTLPGISEKGATSLIGKIAEKSAQLGVEGGIMTAPTAITEAMLGDLDSAAESLAFGVGIGAALGAGGGLLSGTASKIKKLGGEFLTKRQFNKQKDIDSAFQALDVSDDVIDFINTQKPDVAERLPDFLRDTIAQKGGLKGVFSASALRNGIKQQSDDILRVIDNDLNFIDDAVDKMHLMADDVGRMNIVDNSFNASSLVSHLDDVIIQPNASIPGLESQVNRARKFIQNTQKQLHGLEGNSVLSPKRVFEIRQGIAGQIAGKKINNIVDQAKVEAVNYIDNFFTDTYLPKIKDFVPNSKVQANRMTEFLKRFRVSEEAFNLANAKTSPFRPTSAGFIVDKLRDVTLDFGGLFIASDAMKNVGKQMDTVVEKALGGVTPVRAGAINILDRLIDFDDEGMTKKQKMKAVAERLSELNSNPEAIISSIDEIAKPIGDMGAPAVAGLMTTKMQEAVSHLNSIIPKPEQTPNSLFKPREWEPSDLDTAKFERQAQIILDPFSILDNVRDGSLTADQVEILDRMYPRIAAKMREKIIEDMAENPRDVKYGQKLKLGMLLGIDTDVNVKSDFLRTYQQTFAQPEQKEKAQGFTPSSLNLPTEAAVTDVQRITAK